MVRNKNPFSFSKKLRIFLFHKFRKRAALYTKTASAFLDTTSLANSEAEIEYDSRKQIKYGNSYQAAWGIFSEYCDNTTIHGIKYLGEQKRPILER